MFGNKILIVEDEVADALLLKRAFTNINPNLQIDLVNDGQEALDILDTPDHPTRALASHPSCMLLDLKLRTLDGWEVLSKVKGTSKLRPLPIIVLTSSSDPNDIKRAYDLGANSYLVKPVKASELKNTAKAIHGYWLEMNQNPEPAHVF